MSRFQNLQDWLRWQESLHGQEIELGLDRIKQVYLRLNIDWGDTVFLTIGGTNGKGSTVAFLNAIYQHSNYTVGQFTSPHFLDYRERIQVNSEMVDELSLCKAFAEIDSARADISLTYFEFSTLAALLVFAQKKVDVVLMEVGLGGRLDASNIVDADCSIVTSISLDHRDWLGDDVEQIGYEKAGIYRPNKPAIFGDASIPNSVQSHANNIAAQWYGREQQFFVCKDKDSWRLNWEGGEVTALPYPSMMAPVQLNNAACAVLAVQLLQDRLPVLNKEMFQPIRMTQVAGRMQRFISNRRSPEVILDVAHNEEAAKAVVSATQKYNADKPIHLVLAMLADKEVSATVSVLAALKPFLYCTAPNSPRALSADDLYSIAQQGEWSALTVHSSVTVAFNAAMAQVEEQGVILVLGSFFTVSEVLGLLKKAGYNAAPAALV